MNDPIAVALQFGFLAVLFLFLPGSPLALRDLRRGGDADVADAGEPGSSARTPRVDDLRRASSRASKSSRR